MSELGPVRRILLPNIEHVEICVIAIRIRQCIMTAGNEEETAPLASRSLTQTHQALD